MNGSRCSEILLLFLERFETTVKFIIILGCMVMFCSQVALTQVGAREYLSYVDQLEGHRIQGELAKFAAEPLDIIEKSVTAVPDKDAGAETRLLVITLLDALPQDRAGVIVNERQEYPFINGEVALKVQEGDVLEINGSSTEKLLKFSINIPHQDIEFPISGLLVETKGKKTLLGTVRFKHK